MAPGETILKDRAVANIPLLNGIVKQSAATRCGEIAQTLGAGLK
jgi:hypothetical protein